MNATMLKVFRVFLGGFMVALGLNKFLGFIPIPSPPGDGGELMRIYVSSGFLKLIGVLEFAGGLALVLNRFVPLALTFIVAIMFNACLFHALHEPRTIVAAAVSLALSLALVHGHRERFAELLKA